MLKKCKKNIVMLCFTKLEHCTKQNNKKKLIKLFKIPKSSLNNSWKIIIIVHLFNSYLTWITNLVLSKYSLLFIIKPKIYQKHLDELELAS